MTELYATDGFVPGGRLDALPDGARTAVCLDDFVVVEGSALPLLLACDLMELFDADSGKSGGDSSITDSICPGRM